MQGRETLCRITEKALKEILCAITKIVCYLNSDLGRKNFCRITEKALTERLRENAKSVFF